MIKDAQHVDGAAPHYRVTLEGTSRFLRVWAAQPKLFFGTLPIGEFAAPLGYQLYLLTAVVLSIGTWVALLVGVVITSFFIPNMLRKGTVDLLLVKPIQRWVLLFYKYIGGLTFIFFSTVYALGGMWLVLGIRTGLWANWALLLIVTITFFFAILYAISTFVAVVTRSTVTAIMVTLFAWFIFFGIGTANKIFADQYQVEEVRKKAREAQQIKPADGEEDEGWGHSQGAWIIFGLHKVMPRTSDLNQINDLIVFCDFLTGSLDDMDTFDTTKPNRWESLIVSALWITVFLGLASAWFTFKDY
jgi:ABC-type transport system involved in multi-copper enzyme maturation permease subunit